MIPERIAELRKLASSEWQVIGDECRALSECLDEIERIQKRPTGPQLAAILVGQGIVQAAAIDDPDGYDGSQTLMAVNSAAEKLRQL